MRFPVILLSSVLALLLVGCAGYKLGPTGGMKAGARSVQVNFFKNETPEPRLVESVNQSLRRELQQDGTYRLATKNDGDYIVTGSITKFERSPVSFQPADVISVRDYKIQLIAKVTVTERASGRTVFDREVAGHTTIRVGTDLNSAERQAVPLLAEDLALRITSLFVNGDW